MLIYAFTNNKYHDVDLTELNVAASYYSLITFQQNNYLPNLFKINLNCKINNLHIEAALLFLMRSSKVVSYYQFIH